MKITLQAERGWRGEKVCLPAEPGGFIDFQKVHSTAQLNLTVYPREIMVFI